MTTFETLKAARRLIELPRHWCQNEYKNLSGARCMVKALVDAPFSGGSYTGAYEALQSAIGEQESMVGFNDSHTHAEVLAAFDEAIARLESQ